MIRGGVLALVALALGRTTVSFQFQSVTALAEKLSFDVPPTALGVLLGLYMAPGVAAAIAAPALLRRFGSMGSLNLAFGLMALGQCGVVLADSLSAAYAARFLAGVGGCVVYVVTVGFVAQLQDAGPMSRRMGVIASSWPIGNALALVLLGSLLVHSNIGGWVPLLLVLLAASMIALKRQHIRGGGSASEGSAVGPITFGAWRSAIKTGFGIAISFALYNVAFILVTSFSPRLLVGEGISSEAATGVSSLPMWLFVLSVPFGGLLAGWMGRYERAQVAVGCLGSALCLLLVLVTPYKIVWYVLAGLLGGLPTAPMWASAGGKSGDAHANHLTYPALFLVFFASLLAFPPAVGAIVELTEDPRLALVVCSVMLVSASVIFLAARRNDVGAKGSR